MQAFTKNLRDFNQKHSIFEDSIAERLSSEQPQLEYAFSAGEAKDLAPSFGEASQEAKIIALLPLNDHPKVRKSLQEAFHGITSGLESCVAVDMDIDAPHTELLGGENTEGISDHFLYGVSPAKILRPSPLDPQVKTLGAGTFTPRIAETYLDPRWRNLIDWTAGQTEGPVILLGPPLERFADLAALESADQVVIFTDPLDSMTQGKLPGLIDKVRKHSSGKSSMRFVWLAEESEEQEEKEAEDSQAEDQKESEKAGEKGALPSPADQQEIETAPQDEEAEPAPAKQTEESTLDLEMLDELKLPELELIKDEEKIPAIDELPVSPPQGAEDQEMLVDELGLPEFEPVRDEEEVLPADEELFSVPEGSAGDEESLTLEGAVQDKEQSPAFDDMLMDEGKDSVPQNEESGAPSEEEPEDLETDKLPDIKDITHAEDTLEEGALQAEMSEQAQDQQSEEEVFPEEEARAPEITGTKEPEPDEIEAEALFTQAEPEDELESEEKSGMEDQALDEEFAAEAMALMESFEETLNAPVSDELDLDTDPLGEKAKRAETKEKRVPVPEAEQEPEQVPQAEEEPAGEEEEVDILDEEDLEPVEEELEEAPAAVEEEAELAEAAEGPEPVEMEAGEEPAGGEPLDETELKELEKITSEATEVLAETEGNLPGEATAGPVEAESGLQAEEAPEEEALIPEETLEEIDELIPTEEARGKGAVAESGPAIKEETQEELIEEPVRAGADEMDLGSMEFGEPGEEIDLGDLGGPPVKKAARPARRKAKPSKGKPVLVLLTLSMLATGMFFIWKQGTVSTEVRRMSEFFSEKGISINSLKEYIIQISERETIAETQPKEEQIIEKPAEPQYTKLGYSIQLGSFRFLPQAIEARNTLLKSGLANVYIVPLELDSLGNWNRLYVGFFGTTEEADSALAKLAPFIQKAGMVGRMHGNPIKRPTTFALKIGDFSANDDSLEIKRQRLEENNIPAYTVPLQPGPDSPQAVIYRLYVGAFETEEQAVYMREKIFNIGLRAEMIERAGLAKEKG